jgi:hypothetical protein
MVRRYNSRPGRSQNVPQRTRMPGGNFGSRIAVFPLFAVTLIASLAPAQERISGFTPASSARQLATEEKFKAIPSPVEERRQHRIFTLQPHPAGSARNNQLARYIAREWKKQGLEEVVIHRYDVYSTSPRETSL